VTAGQVSNCQVLDVRTHCGTHLRCLNPAIGPMISVV
jgi:hypothetical protein